MDTPHEAELRPAPVPVRISLLDLLGIEPPKHLWVSNTILALNVLVFAAMVISGADLIRPSVEEILRFGANHGPALAAGEWWRLVSCAFVHVGLLHLVFNMWALRSLSVVEAVFGNGAYVLIYIASAIGGSVASALWNPGGVSAGASGAVFGVAGALLVFFARRRSRIPAAIFRPIMRSMLMFVGLNALFGLLVPGIDNAAHLGGLFVGACAGLALDRRVGSSTRLDSLRLLRGVGIVLVPCAFAALVPWRVAQVPGVEVGLMLGKAEDAFRAQDFEKAIADSTRVLERDPSNASAYELRATSWSSDHAEEALADASRALELDSSLNMARQVRASVHWNRMQGELALADYTELVRRMPDEGEALLLHAFVAYSLGRWSEAAEGLRSAADKDPALGSEVQMYLWLARVRAGERAAATADLRAFLALPLASTGAHIELEAAACFAGKISEADFFGQCESSTATPEEKAKIEFVLGSKRLVDGDPKGAHEHFEAVLKTKAVLSPCYLITRYELARL